jgi:hypothetical protein
VTDEVFERAKTTLAKKKPNLDTSRARLEKITEGLCVQVMHIGSYDDEPATIAAMDKYAVENGYAMDINDTRRHHEIYLSDPRKTAPEKLLLGHSQFRVQINGHSLALGFGTARSLAILPMGILTLPSFLGLAPRL